MNGHLEYAYCFDWQHAKRMRQSRALFRVPLRSWIAGKCLHALLPSLPEVLARYQVGSAQPHDAAVYMHSCQTARQVLHFLRLVWALVSAASSQQVSDRGVTVFAASKMLNYEKVRIEMLMEVNSLSVPE